MADHITPAATSIEIKLKIEDINKLHVNVHNRILYLDTYVFISRQGLWTY
jgi:hypothetical protein